MSTIENSNECSFVLPASIADDVPRIVIDTDGSIVDQSGNVILPNTIRQQVCSPSLVSPRHDASLEEEAMPETRTLDATAQAIIDILGGQIKDIKSDVNKLGTNMQKRTLQIDARLDDHEAELRLTRDAQRNADKRVDVIHRDLTRKVNSIEDRVKALEEGQGACGRPPAMSMFDILQLEASRIAGALDDARGVAHYVVITSTDRKPVTTQEVAHLLAPHSAASDVDIQIRGKIAVVEFKTVADKTGSTRAAEFEKKHDRNHSKYWVRVDKPETLRDLERRGREFGKYFVGGTSAERCRYSFLGGFLIINDVVIGPLPLIPHEKYWHDLAAKIENVLLRPHIAINKSNPLITQVRTSIVHQLLRGYNRPEFLGDDSEVLAADEADFITADASSLPPESVSAGPNAFDHQCLSIQQPHLPPRRVPTNNANQSSDDSESDRASTASLPQLGTKRRKAEKKGPKKGPSQKKGQKEPQPGETFKPARKLRSITCPIFVDSGQ